ncbi:MAG TPA: helix-turn-helix transcriptional regulator [Candidatus Bipolaricaulis anaerobius]|nr:helix-turn-helix transcriptional regulator [Candidatus Bipolaricaulis anaerobius]
MPVTRQARAAPFDHERAVGRIRQAFRRKFELQSEFAKALGWSEMKVSRMLRGETQLDLPDLLHVCKVLRLSADYVLGLMPEEAFAAAQKDEGLVAIPFVPVWAVGDDLVVAATVFVCQLPAEVLAKGIAHHAGIEPPLEWPYGRFVLCDLSSAVLPPSGGLALVDRRPCLDVLHGMTVLASSGDGVVTIGRVYEVGGTITLVPEAGPPRPLSGSGDIAGAVVVLGRPVAAVG